jgi:hypothetical protein
MALKTNKDLKIDIISPCDDTVPDEIMNIEDDAKRDEMRFEIRNYIDLLTSTTYTVRAAYRKLNGAEIDLAKKFEAANALKRSFEELETRLTNVKDAIKKLLDDAPKMQITVSLNDEARKQVKADHQQLIDAETKLCDTSLKNLGKLIDEKFAEFKNLIESKHGIVMTSRPFYAFSTIFVMLAVFFGIVVFANIYMICSPILTQLCWIFGIGMVLALVAVYYATKPRDD